MSDIIIDDVISNLEKLQYPFMTNDRNTFINSLKSPTQLRNDTIDWLFHQMECELLDKLDNKKLEQTTRLQIMFKFFGIIETKDNILGMSSELNNMKCLLNLTNFVIKYIKFKKEPEIGLDEVKKSYSLLNYIQKNKINIFKENIRLFLPEINKNFDIQMMDKININTLYDNITSTKKLIEKIEHKLNKLIKLNFQYEDITHEDEIALKQHLAKFDKEIDVYLKDFNNLYEKELKYISDDKMGKLHLNCSNFLNSYNQLENIASTLEQIFAFHNKIIDLPL